MTTAVFHGGVGDRLTGSPGAGRLLLVGGGPACASVLIRLAGEPGAGADPAEIVLVDPGGETGGGEPYAAGISAALLANDPLSAVASCGIGFDSWLRDRRSAWWDRLSGDPDPRVARWVRRNGAAVAGAAWDDLFLPRCLFGDFIRERFAAAARTLAGRGVRVRVLCGWVTGLRPAAAGWQVWIDGRLQPWHSDAVVLGVGSLPPAVPGGVAGHPAYFGRRRARDVGALGDALADLPAGPAPVVVLGGAAAACEVLYLLEDVEAGGLVVVSRGGRLPDGLPSGRAVAPRAPWRPPEPTAAALLHAVLADLDRGRVAGYSVVDLLPALRVSFDRAFAALPPVEKGRFVTDCAPRYRAAIRHISPDYDTAIRRLRAAGRLVVRTGEATTVTPAGAGLRVSCLEGGRLRRQAARAVFDCRGFTGVRETVQPAVADLLATGAAAANPCGRGLDVDAGLAAAPGLYVLGPALSGTSRGDDQIWSQENIPRIWAIADRVSAGVRDHLRTVAARGRWEDR